MGPLNRRSLGYTLVVLHQADKPAQPAKSASCLQDCGSQRSPDIQSQINYHPVCSVRVAPDGRLFAVNTDCPLLLPPAKSKQSVGELFLSFFFFNCFTQRENSVPFPHQTVTVGTNFQHTSPTAPANTASEDVALFSRRIPPKASKTVRHSLGTAPGRRHGDHTFQGW